MSGADARVVATGRNSTLIRAEGAEGAEHSFGPVSSTPAVMDAMLAYFDPHLKPS